MDSDRTEVFKDRLLTCLDCGNEFVFTAGEQLFFVDKQFKNDPKRCKPCKSRRSGGAAVRAGSAPASAGISRTETRTLCSECGIETTVPFKPTQGRPVLCRQCFQVHAKTVAASPAFADPAATALTEASENAAGAFLSPEAAVQAASSIATASAISSVATAADLALIATMAATPMQVAASEAAATPEPVPAAVEPSPLAQA